MKHLPILMIVVSALMFGMSYFLRQGAEGTHIVVTNLTSSFMFFAGCVCVVVGIAMHLKREDEPLW